MATWQQINGEIVRISIALPPDTDREECTKFLPPNHGNISPIIKGLNWFKLTFTWCVKVSSLALVFYLSYSCTNIQRGRKQHCLPMWVKSRGWNLNVQSSSQLVKTFRWWHSHVYLNLLLVGVKVNLLALVFYPIMAPSVDISLFPHVCEVPRGCLQSYIILFLSYVKFQVGICPTWIQLNE